MGVELTEFGDAKAQAKQVCGEDFFKRPPIEEILVHARLGLASRWRHSRV
jgi:hypothetical protein